MEFWPGAFPIWFRRRIPGRFGNQPLSSLLPYTFDPSGMSDGVLPWPWVGGTFSISSGTIINTPTEGSDVVVNGDMESGSPPSGWTPSSATLAADPDAHSGSQALKATSTAAAGRASQNLTVTKDIWYVPEVWVKRTAGQIDVVAAAGAYSASMTNLPYHLSPVVYTNYRGAILPSAAAVTLSLRGFDNGTVAYWDDVSCKPLTAAGIFASIDFGPGSEDVTVKANITLSGYSPMGVICNLDNATTPKYYILAFITSRNVLGMFQCINGTITQLLDTAAVYSDGALLEIRKIANNIYQIWYKGVQIGADQTVTDANLNNNTLHGIFSTGGGSYATSFFVVAA